MNINQTPPCFGHLCTQQLRAEASSPPRAQAPSSLAWRASPPPACGGLIAELTPSKGSGSPCDPSADAESKSAGVLTCKASAAEVFFIVQLARIAATNQAAQRSFLRLAHRQHAG
eukprot:CAMPEP_0173092552 /NCGR_PEP_ID=MMETSP1102-20130122/29122_1 /TAXON_ID=49646 /ORGANISM="Geminigera sp., Strain Caron Lab Isolate" /LENGTH=114 /DNA_ID=CAMNT_0013979717 /DNA_START=463 /DNA_END=807 /DNA_ORIENTATION=-